MAGFPKPMDFRTMKSMVDVDALQNLLAMIPPAAAGVVPLLTTWVGALVFERTTEGRP